VGDLPYYSRVGFKRQKGQDLRLPGPVDPDRLLIRELVEGAAEGLEGLIEKPAGAVQVKDDDENLDNRRGTLS
jgi:predicted N-acetyltransferase YhbS